jgi:hypothetical protein
MGMQFKLTITVNLSDGTEINDLELEGTFTSDEIGDAAWKAAAGAQTEHSVITSLVIVAVVA